MMIRYIPADPAGNLTAIVLSPVAAQDRAKIAAEMMARCPEGFEQVGFADETSLTGDLPTLCMMGGEFCGNATRAFACYAAKVRGRGETRLAISVSGAREPVPVAVDLRQNRAYAQMPLPYALEWISVNKQKIPLVRMEGIDHVLLLDAAPSPEAAERVLAAMPKQDARGVLFVQGGKMTPLVEVAATGTRVWESSCGSGTVALAWYLAQNLADGMHAFAFDEPGEEREGFPLISPKQAWTAEALIDAYGDELLRLCLLYLGDRQLAEDAFQETMVKAWRALPDFRGESGAKTWLFHIAVNTCRDMLRSGWMRMRKSSVPLEVMPELAGQEDGHLRELTASVLALPGKYREIIVLFYYKQMKIREIAEALHMPTASVSSRLRRARAMLKIDMEGGKDA